MNREYFSVELSTGIDLALPLTYMKVVAQFKVANICIIPGVADFWYGVTNFKGSLVWVLDSDRFLMPSLHEQSSKSRLATLGSFASCEETTPVPTTEGTSATDWLPKTAQHRFFNINKSDRQSLKITTVILHQQQAQKQLALATSQLKGILSIEPSSLKPIEDDTSILSKCCNGVVQTEVSTYIIEPTALLQQLQEQSRLDAKSLMGTS